MADLWKFFKNNNAFNCEIESEIHNQVGETGSYRAVYQQNTETK